MRTTTLFAAISALSLHPAPAGEPGVPIVFVSRDVNLEVDPSHRAAPVELARWGRLLVREVDGTVRVLVDARAAGAGPRVPLDVMDPDVSWDGKRIVFSGWSPGDGAFRIFIVDSDGRNLRQVTSSDREADLTRFGSSAPFFRTYDDLEPCWLPDGRICFSSTRLPGLAPDGRLRATNLYVIGEDGSGLHRITSEKFAADGPVVDPDTGRIIYSRWWRSAELRRPSTPEPAPIPPGSSTYPGSVRDPGELPESRPLRSLAEEEFPGLNHWFLASINPDGTDLRMYAGTGLDRRSTQAYRPVFFGYDELLAHFPPETPLPGVPGRSGLRRVRAGTNPPELLKGPQDFADAQGRIGGGTVFHGLAEGGWRDVASARRQGDVDYGLHLVDHQMNVSPLLDLPGSSELDPAPLISRTKPPVIADRATDVLSDDPPRDLVEAFAAGGSFTFLVENIHSSGPVDDRLPHAPPPENGLAIEFYASLVPSPSGDDRPLLIHRQEIPLSGRVEAKLPAGVPLFEVLRRPDGSLAQGRDGQIFHVGGFNFGRRGTTARCVGCHAGHSMLEMPGEPAWANLAPAARVEASSSRGRRELAQENLVDRSGESVIGEWQAERTGLSSIELNWKNPLRGKEVVVYGPRQERGEEVRQAIEAFTVEYFARGASGRRVQVLERIVPEGTRVPLDSSVDFDTLRIEIEQRYVDGPFLDQYTPALAEVEVMARRVDGPARASFLRGDADCDQQVALTDAVAILGSRFNGAGSLCCDAAADLNGDGELNLSDPVYLLSHLFLAGPDPASPFPRCSQSLQGPLSCDRDGCPEWR